MADGLKVDVFREEALALASLGLPYTSIAELVETETFLRPSKPSSIPLEEKRLAM